MVSASPFHQLYSFSAASLVSSTSGGSSPENNNYLRVSAAFGQRRLSDNVLTAPGNRRMSGIGVVPSSVSSPGSAPGTPLSVGFPIRRHSSAFAANRRYSSNALLSPSTNSQVMYTNIWLIHLFFFVLNQHFHPISLLHIEIIYDSARLKLIFFKKSKYLCACSESFSFLNKVCAWS